MALPACEHGIMLNVDCPDCEKESIKNLRELIDSTWITWGPEEMYNNEAGRDKTRMEVLDEVFKQENQMTAEIVGVLNHLGVEWPDQKPVNKDRIKQILEKVVDLETALNAWVHMGKAILGDHEAGIITGGQGITWMSLGQMSETDPAGFGQLARKHGFDNAERKYRERMGLALKSAANALYFNDSTDFRGALWDVCRALAGDELVEDWLANRAHAEPPMIDGDPDLEEYVDLDKVTIKMENPYE